jgi:hypothetical protein
MFAPISSAQDSMNVQIEKFGRAGCSGRLLTLVLGDGSETYGWMRPGFQHTLTAVDHRSDVLVSIIFQMELNNTIN